MGTPPGRSSILVYTSALWTAPLAALLLRERLPLTRGLGVVSGALGVVVLVQPRTVSWQSAGVRIGYGLLLLAAVGTAFGAVHIRGHRWQSTPLNLMPWQLTGAGLITTLVALGVEGRPTFELDGPVVGILLYQVLLASTFGVWGVLTIGRSLPAVSASLLLMAVPAVGLLSSALFVGEELTGPVLIGMALVFGGVATSLLSDGGGRRPASASTGRADQVAPV
ncbi:MAG: EamA family transporter [Actinomycetota bacterium]